MYIIENPHIPSAHPMEESLKAGTEVEVKGGVHDEFAIELLSGDNIVLHMNFRFEENHELVLNSFLNQAWGTEVRHLHPLRRHNPFCVRIYVHEGYFNITVNNDLLVEFDHRFPVMAVQAIGIKGSVHVETITFKGFEFKTEWKQRNNLVNGAVSYAYDSVPNAPSLVQIEGTQHY
ncbi:CRE-LEC-7 protein [Caenorhabditis remanei]|uniref:Galectin n=1 Tax=Caenorhabditis remanei TaxID=31234 RepID=E3MMG2_CAERE|nr:CRE-LEC-7 protein [Caenorhabditis remanei]